MNGNLKKCKSCGDYIEKSASKCPHCNAKQHRGVYMACSVIILLTAVLCVMTVKNPPSKTENGDHSASTSQNLQGISDELALLEDDYIKASYIEIFEEPSAGGVFYLRLRIENKSKKELWVALTDASVNGMSTPVLSGIPMVIQPNTSSKAPFIISYSNLDISEISGLEKITFKFMVSDNESMEQLEETAPVTITLNS